MIDRVYYSWLKDHAQLDQTHLPSITDFYDDLSETDISQSDYDHANHVWDKLGLKDMRGFAFLYLVRNSSSSSIIIIGLVQTCP